MQKPWLWIAAGVTLLVLSGCATGPARKAKQGQIDIRPQDAANRPVDASAYLFLPKPRALEIAAPRHLLPMHGRALFTGPGSGEPFLQMVALDALRAVGGEWESVLPSDVQPDASFAVDPKLVTESQGYQLSVDANGIHVIAHDADGLLYAAMTLKQLARAEKGTWTLPSCSIRDYPDFPNRGVMLDISRDKVPTMDTLRQIVDRMAQWKLNQLQLYIENTFAYKNYPMVWEKFSPMTPEEIRALDAYCRERHIQLVPNQNSFGHMERWLSHPELQHLGELPNGGAVLCPTNSESITFLDGLYAELLPNFTSRQFNVGCDETQGLGAGRSKEAVRKNGEGRVYLDFLLQIHELVAKRGFQMQFWGDIIMAHPELISELPKDVIAMEWGYEANHPFEEHGQRFAASGIPYYVVPGTSTWLSFAGRTTNAVGNLRNAALNGKKNGAIGYLITDWGDFGHLQPMPASYLGFAYGAGLSWGVNANIDMDIPRVLNAFAFMDEAGVMGELAYDLGDAYAKSGALYDNRTLYYVLLFFESESKMTSKHLSPITMEGLQSTETAIQMAIANLAKAKMDRPDAGLITEEFTQTARLMLFACHVGEARLKAGGVGISQLPADAKAALAEELRPLIPEHRRIWLQRNRPGGLNESAASLENVLKKLEGQ